jgi:large-conductance mechanosensitive channel
VNRILKPVTYVLAAVYFLVDAAFLAVVKPISNWIATHLVLRKLRAWIRSLRPYPSLALFSVPVIILEPVKPLAAYLAATGQIVSSVVTLIVGEILKLVLVERLFSLTRDKLMKIPAFAWAYTQFRQAKAWLQATEAWQTIRSLGKAIRDHVMQMKSSHAVRFRQS